MTSDRALVTAQDLLKGIVCECGDTEAEHSQKGTRRCLICDCATFRSVTFTIARAEPLAPGTLDPRAIELALRRERLRRGWSLVRVAGLTGISPTDLSQIERGVRPAYPGWRRRLATAYKLPETVLFAVVPDERRGAAR